MAATENRRYHRVGHDARATLSLAGQTWSCTVEDLSLKGCMVELAEPWPVAAGTVYQLSVHLSYAIHIEMAVQLSHQEGRRVGFRCISIDSDSVAQLKRLVELNLGDSSLLQRDMQALVSGK
ncbi:MAG TPA: PilZ domain-containing protein [Parasulfuritortus sp.]